MLGGTATDIDMRTKSPRTIAGIMLTSLALLLSIPVVDYAVSPQGDWLHPLGFRAWASVPRAGWALAVAVGVVFAAFTILGIHAVRSTWREFSSLKLVSLWAAAGAAVVEEALFRRLIMDGVADAGGNLLLQVLASALGFGAAHAIWGLIKLDLRVAVSSVAATTVMGVGLALVYLAADRNLAPCIVAHFIITGAIEPGLMIAAVTGQWDRVRPLKTRAVRDGAA
jgi:hypothetical protein